MPPAKKTPRKTVFRFEYLTSTVSLMMRAGQGDGIAVDVVNDSAVVQQSRIIIYLNTGAGAVVSADSGVNPIAPNWQWGIGYTVKSSGEYWVRISASSDVLVPKVSFDLDQGGSWVPFVTYRPGDFAVFRLTPTRQRLW